MRNTSYRYWMIYVIAIVAAMGGLLFGFDTGVISGAIPFFQKDFGIDDSMVEVVTSSGLLGAILGALCCGKLTDRIGRRKVILTSAVIFAFGALGSGWAPDIYHLIAARLFLGVAIGISSFAVPLYCGSYPGEVTGDVCRHVPIDDYDRASGILSFGFVFCG